MSSNTPSLISWAPDRQGPASLDQMPSEIISAIYDLKKIAIDFSDRTERRRGAAKVPNILYQYSDVHALMSIQQSGRVWLSDAGYMNDPLEGTWVHRKAVLAASRHLGQSESFHACMKLIDFMNSDAGSTSFISTTELNDELGEFYLLSEFGRAYIGSFTGNGDLLSQWRGYGGGGGGVAIGMDLRAYHPAYAKEDGAFLSVKLIKVVYDEDVQNAELDWLFDRVRSVYDQHHAILKINADALDQLNLRTVYALDEALAEIRWEFKSPSYVEEQEWRLVAPRQKVSAEVHYRTSGGAIVPYIKAPIPGADGGSVVDHLILGPRCPDRVAHGFRSMLNGRWYTKIERSALAYR